MGCVQHKFFLLLYLFCWIQREFFEPGSEHMFSSKYKVTCVTLGKLALEAVNNLSTLLNDNGLLVVFTACSEHLLYPDVHT